MQTHIQKIWGQVACACSDEAVPTAMKQLGISDFLLCMG